MLSLFCYPVGAANAEQDTGSDSDEAVSYVLGQGRLTQPPFRQAVPCCVFVRVLIQTAPNKNKRLGVLWLAFILGDCYLVLVTHKVCTQPPQLYFPSNVRICIEHKSCHFSSVYRFLDIFAPFWPWECSPRYTQMYVQCNPCIILCIALNYLTRVMVDR